MPKLKMFAAIPRKLDISAQEFHDHWRHPHGTMGRRISILRKYVQSHQIHCDLLGPDQVRFEGIAEAWMDSASDAYLFPDEPVYKADLIPDEPLFIDLPNLKFVFTTEEVLMSGPQAAETDAPGDAIWFDDDRSINIKLLQLIEAEDNGAWRSETDAKIGRQLGAFRHVCCTAHPEIHADAPPFLGVRELWWPTLSAFTSGVAAAQEIFFELINRPSRAVTLLVQAERFK